MLRSASAPALLAVLVLAMSCSSSNKHASNPTAAATVAGQTPGGVAPSAAAAPTRSPAPAVSSVVVPRSPTPTAAGAGDFVELLSVIPDTAETRQEVDMSDFATMRRLLKIDAPADPADADQKAAYVKQLATLPRAGGYTFIGGLGSYALVSTVEKYLGYRRVDQDVAAGVPPHRYEAARGQFDPQAADRAIAACKDCPPAQRGQYQGVSFYSWGEDLKLDFTHRLAPPAYDELGRGGRVVVTQQYVLHTVWTEGIQQMIAASRGKSLRSDQNFSLLAQGLDELQTYNATLTDKTQGPEEAKAAIAEATAIAGQRPAVATAWALQGGAPVLEPYVLIGAGVGRDASGQPYTGVALVHANAQAAMANAMLVQQRISKAVSTADGQPWSSKFKSVDVRVNGRMLEVTLHGSAMGPGFIYNRDPLFLHR